MQCTHAKLFSFPSPEAQLEGSYLPNQPNLTTNNKFTINNQGRYYLGTY